MIVFIIVSLIFFVLGFVLRSGKGDWLIAGYNMLPEEEKNKYDKLKLCKFMGNLLISIASILIINFVCDRYLRFPHEFIIFIALIFIVVFGSLIYANTGNRFIKKE
ncbi:MAG: DUF3784 domain-containing protein [Spirochaetes bacterium]|nr:DUF3784 domain-containing protein [Spirochaetota bacterium]